MSSGFGPRPNPPPLLRYASCAAELTPASKVAFKQISRKCLVVCTAERSKGGGFGKAEAGGHERRSAYPQSFASPTIPNYKLKGQPNKRRIEKMSAGQNRIEFQAQSGKEELFRAALKLNHLSPFSQGQQPRLRINTKLGTGVSDV